MPKLPLKKKTSCSTITLKDISVPAGKTLDMTDLNDGTKIIFEGTTTFGYKEWKGPLISVSGSDITVEGATGHIIDGKGAKWWDGKGGNGGKTKPKFFYAHKLKNSVISNLNVKNTPVHAFSIKNADNLAITDITLDNSDGDAQGGHNTDAFDVGESDGVTISGADVKNQDDCLAVNSGTNIVFKNGVCIGGHGLSIGSVGGRDDNTVKQVTISDSTVKNSQYGVRIKTNSGTKGKVDGVTFKNIKLDDIEKYGIVIEQDYLNGGPTGKPTDGVPITDVKMENVKGTVDKKGYNVKIVCAKGACEDWTWTAVEVSGGKSYAECQGIPSGLNSLC